MKKIIKYKICIYTLLSLSLFSPFNKNRDKKINSDLNNIISIPYSNGVIYITDNSNNIILNNSDIQVVDERYTEDPNMKVLDSYKITSLREMKEIISILKEYNKDTSWNRSVDSMRNEWVIHNFCYHMNIFVNRSENVDFNNEDELIYLGNKIN